MLSSCTGCYPIYQANQLAHMDFGGCLYQPLTLDEISICIPVKEPKLIHKKIRIHKRKDKDKTLDLSNKSQPTKCSGCHPIYQANQMAHMDFGGCLYCDQV